MARGSCSSSNSNRRSSRRLEVDRAPQKRSKEEIRRALQEARGAWGRGKTPEEIDQEIEARRAEDWPDDGVATR